MPININVRLRVDPPPSQFAKLKGKALAEMARAANTASRLLTNNLKSMAPSFRGRLRSSIRGVVFREGDAIRTTVSIDAPYAHAVDQGQAPGRMRPWKDLVAWVAQKKSEEGRQGRRAAYAIARAIAAGRTRANQAINFVQRAMSRAMPAIRAAFRGAAFTTRQGITGSRSAGVR